MSVFVEEIGSEKDSYMNKDDKKKYWPLIDVAKLVCALLVVLIHCVEVKQGHPVATFIVQCFAGQAVPFFLIVSGFFCARKIMHNNMVKIIKISIRNWLILYLAWSVLWLPYYICFYRKQYPGSTMLYQVIMIIRRYIFAGQGVYWYLLVLFESVIIVAFFVKHNMDKALYIISICGVAIGILYDANVNVLWMRVIHRVIYFIFSWSNNLFMKGIPYVTIGYLFYKNKEKYSLKKIDKIIIGYAVSSIAMIIIYVLGKKEWLCVYPLQAVFLFMGTISIGNDSSFNESITRICRNLSSSIYYLHTIFIYGVIDVICGTDSMILLKFGIAVILSIIVYVIFEITGNKTLKWLIGVK